MSLFVQMIVVGLAAWRISSLFVDEEGPFRIFEKIRELSGIKNNEVIVIIPDNILGQLLGCVWCLSVWVTIPVWFLYKWEPEVVYVIAAMSVAVMVHGVSHRE